ncbi:uncharacterized protein LOC111745658 [Pteropus vampyrus]|uniref:Uncharacterized protein LOC111745658 n=1 Tax=Pteropus vampyrus TaxID=132908 RepID=A0A6P6CZR2_PTEVA|nr:uncharacterized protein LOC111745658 [Pteropus vampyrus]
MESVGKFIILRHPGSPGDESPLKFSASTVKLALDFGAETGHRPAAWHPGLLCRLRSPTAGSASPRPWACSSWAGDRDVAGHWQPPQCSWGAGVFQPREAEARGPDASGSPRSPSRAQCAGPDAETSQSPRPPSALTPASQASPRAPVPARSQTMRPTRARGQSSLTLRFPLSHIWAAANGRTLILSQGAPSLRGTLRERPKVSPFWKSQALVSEVGSGL